jgi:hypothetical protein
MVGGAKRRRGKKRKKKKKKKDAGLNFYIERFTTHKTFFNISTKNS